MRYATLTIIFSAVLLMAGCSSEEPPPLRISQILSSEAPIEEGKTLPEFKQFFGTGITALYTSVWLENTSTMTGSFSVRLRWFYPNDFTPPMMQHMIEMEPGQTVAQFSIHNDSGLRLGPYLIHANTGKDMTLSGSARVYVGMTPTEAEDFLSEEQEMIRLREEKRKEAEERAEAVAQDEEAEEGAEEEVKIEEEEEAGEEINALKEENESKEGKDQKKTETTDDVGAGDFPPGLTGGAQEND